MESTSMRGERHDSRRGIRRVWDADIPFTVEAEAKALARMLHGDGWMFDLTDGLHSINALGPQPGYTGFSIDPDKSNKFDIGCAVFDNLFEGRFIRIDAQLQNWQIMWLEDDGDMDTWVHYARTSDGRGYAAGVRDDTVGTIGGTGRVVVQVFEGVVFLSKEGTADLNLDDIVVLPYNMPETFFPSLSADTSRFGPNPMCRLTGDIITEDHTFVRGDVTGAAIIQGAAKDGSGWQNNARTPKITLVEFSDAFMEDVDVPSQGTVTLPNDPPVQQNPVPDFQFEV